MQHRFVLLLYCSGISCSFLVLCSSISNGGKARASPRQPDPCHPKASHPRMDCQAVEQIVPHKPQNKAGITPIIPKLGKANKPQATDK
jgi:hypothetical protein